MNTTDQRPPPGTGLRPHRRHHGRRLHAGRRHAPADRHGDEPQGLRQHAPPGAGLRRRRGRLQRRLGRPQRQLPQPASRRPSTASTGRPTRAPPGLDDPASPNYFRGLTDEQIVADIAADPTQRALQLRAAGHRPALHVHGLPHQRRGAGDDRGRRQRLHPRLHRPRAAQHLQAPRDRHRGGVLRPRERGSAMKHKGLKRQGSLYVRRRPLRPGRRGPRRPARLGPGGPGLHRVHAGLRRELRRRSTFKDAAELRQSARWPSGTHHPAPPGIELRRRPRPTAWAAWIYVSARPATSRATATPISSASTSRARG
ncbi:MAG: hypothetical protein MZV64_49310 [Ignavibacteriales bacterium]|nr:hypothetical protein [Ignavibacteriales bacterium]